MRRRRVAPICPPRCKRSRGPIESRHAASNRFGRRATRRRPDVAGRLAVGADEDEDDFPARGGPSTGLIVGGVVGGVLLLVGLGIGAYFLFRSDTPKDAPAVAEANSGMQAGANRPVAPRPQAQAVNVPPANAQNGNENVLGQGLNGGDANAGQNPPPPNPGVPAPQRPNQAEGAAPVVWQVQPDPLPEPVQPAGPLKMDLPLTAFNKNIFYPTTPSAFAFVIQSTPAGDLYEILNLTTAQRVARVGAKLDLQDPVLSPDGKYLAGKKHIGAKTTAVVVAIPGGKSGAVDVETPGGFQQPIDFAQSGQILASKQEGSDTIFSLWDVKDGKKLREFSAPSRTEPKHRALSPGRKYLAVQHEKNHRILIYDLSTGSLAGELQPPETTNRFGNLQCKGMAFSPDGKELAVLFSGDGPGDRLVSWETAGGKQTVDHKFPRDLGQEASNAFFYQGRPLEWLPDNGGWMAFGQLLIDHDSGGLVFRIPAQPLDGTPRRLLDKSQLVTARGDAFNKRLVIETLPKDQIEVATKAARKGQDPTATQLPEAKQADLSTAKAQQPPVGLVAWTAKPDPAPAPKGQLAAQAIPLRGKSGDMQQLLFSSPDVAQAAILSLEPVGELQHPQAGPRRPLRPHVRQASRHDGFVRARSGRRQ